MKKSKPLATDRVLAFIKAEIAAGRGFPAPSDITRHMGWSTSAGVNDTMIRLQLDGKIRLVERVKSGRGWRYHYAYDGEGK